MTQRNMGHRSMHRIWHKGAPVHQCPIYPSASPQNKPMTVRPERYLHALVVGSMKFDCWLGTATQVSQATFLKRKKCKVTANGASLHLNVEFCHIWKDEQIELFHVNTENL